MWAPSHIHEEGIVSYVSSQLQGRGVGVSNWILWNLIRGVGFDTSFEIKHSAGCTLRGSFRNLAPR